LPNGIFFTFGLFRKYRKSTNFWAAFPHSKIYESTELGYVLGDFSQNHPVTLASTNAEMLESNGN
jgi:hypothetical protein